MKGEILTFEEWFEGGSAEPLLDNNKNMNDKFAFIYSPRFWKLFVVGLVTGLNVALPNNVWVQALNASVAIWFGGSVIVGTMDRWADKKVEAAAASGKVTTVTMPENINTVTATTE